jgi:Raf kinase inhibitor-like YbhB/YbcL family protein
MMYLGGRMKRKILILIFLGGGLHWSCKSPIETVPEPSNTPVPSATFPSTETKIVLEPSEIPLPMDTPVPLEFSLTSPAFGAGQMIPVHYSRKGGDTSPPLNWGEPPSGTKSFTLILYSDPLKDGGGNWVQWILYNIPPDSRSLPENIQPNEDGILADGSQHFKNSWGELDYGGPNPQHTYTFNYYFILYALDTELDLDAIENQMEEEGTLPWIGSSKAVVEEAVKGHILGEGKLIAKFKEKQQ